MKFISTILVISLIACVSFAGDYWPVGIEGTYTYINGSGELLEVTYSSNGEIESRYYLDGGFSEFLVWDMFEEDSDGQVFWSGTTGYWDGAIDPDYGHTFTTPIQFTQLPLVTGASWSTISNAPGFYSPCVVGYGFEVLGESEIEVPYGSFSTFEVQITVILECVPYPQAGSYFLHREIGPVVLPGGYELVSIEGTVPTTKASLGGIKALFR